MENEKWGDKDVRRSQSGATAARRIEEPTVQSHGACVGSARDAADTGEKAVQTCAPSTQGSAKAASDWCWSQAESKAEAAETRNTQTASESCVAHVPTDRMRLSGRSAGR